MSELNEIPGWVENTPQEQAYELSMFDSDDNAQQIEMSREEFIALKAHLAALRGYRIGDLRERLTALVLESNPNQDQPIGDDLQQTAELVRIARLYYERCPDLVVFESDTLDDEIEELAGENDSDRISARAASEEEGEVFSPSSPCEDNR
jgi:hypothetical protein